MLQTILRVAITNLFILNLIYAENYICETDPIYQEYKAGDRVTLDGANLYDNETICNQNCRTYTTCASTIYKDENNTEIDAFYCPSNPYSDLGGDLDGNYFSDDDKCNSVCYKQNNCVPLENTGCTVLDIQYLNPITDFTGKTIYTARKVTYECNNTFSRQIGCAEWKIENQDGTIDYASTPIATAWKSYEGADQAGAMAALMEQPLHLFSGWAGYCESGMTWSNPFNNPMTILSYAIMVYGAAGEGTFGDSVKEGVNKVNTAFDQAATDLGNKIDYLTDSATGTTDLSYDAWLANQQTLAEVNQPVLWDGAVGVTDASNEGFWSSLEEYNTITSFELAGETISLYYTDLAMIALAGLQQSDLDTSKKFMQTWMGDTYNADDASLAYAQCMASIGLSFPNLASSSFGDINNTSSALQAPYQNPIRLTVRQMGILAAATSPNYVAVAYKIIGYDDNLLDNNSDGTTISLDISKLDDNTILTIIAATPDAYYQAGQVICGGKLAVTNNITSQDSTSSDDDGGFSFSTDQAAMMAAKIAISKIPPPYNIMASLAFDTITALDDGDACHDVDIASQWGMIQLKTNRFLNFDQCHQTGSECAWELDLFLFKKCMRERYKYCCYDQILTRIFAEAIKAESGKGWDSCNDITINDFKKLNFRKCNPGENPYPFNCFPADKYNEFIDYLTKQGIENVDIKKAAEQIKNSLAIPNNSCQE